MKRDAEVLVMLRERAKGRTQEQAAARAGMSVRTAAASTNGAAKLPSQLKQPRTYRTRPNPFADDWPWIASQLERRSGAAGPRRCSGCCATATLVATRTGQLRTLQRHIAAWRAQYGPEPRGDLSPGPRAWRGRAVRLHLHEQPGRHAGRRAVPAPGLPPGAGLLECRGRPDLLLGELRGAGRRASRPASGSSAAYRASTAPIISARPSTRWTQTGGRRPRSATGC